MPRIDHIHHAHSGPSVLIPLTLTCERGGSLEGLRQGSVLQSCRGNRPSHVLELLPRERVQEVKLCIRCGRPHPRVDIPDSVRVVENLLDAGPVVKPDLYRRRRRPFIHAKRGRCCLDRASSGRSASAPEGLPLTCEGAGGGGGGGVVIFAGLVDDRHVGVDFARKLGGCPPLDRKRRDAESRCESGGQQGRILPEPAAASEAGRQTRGQAGREEDMGRMCVRERERQRDRVLELGRGMLRRGDTPG